MYKALDKAIANFKSVAGKPHKISEGDLAQAQMLRAFADCLEQGTAMDLLIACTITPNKGARETLAICVDNPNVHKPVINKLMESATITQGELTPS